MIARLVLSRQQQRPLTGPPVPRSRLVEVCELLGLNPRDVRSIVLEPTEVVVEHYATREDGTRYAPRRRAQDGPVTFTRTHRVVG